MIVLMVTAFKFLLPEPFPYTLAIIGVIGAIGALGSEGFCPTLDYVEQRRLTISMLRN